MRIMVLGCGEMGSGVVKQLVKYSDANITAADIDIKKAEELVAKFSSNRVSAQFIDINDHDSLVKSIKDASPDVVASTVGPFYQNAGKVYRGCIDAGVNCVDICDDIAGAKEALSLHEEAKRAGITIISGLGDSPGLTNIIVKYCADKMDHVDDVNILWIAPLSNIGVAQFEHGIYCFAYPHQYVDGKLLAMGGKVTADFPPPIGKIELLYCDHPEPYTIPIYTKGVKNVRCAGAVWPKTPVPIEDIAGFGAVLTQPIEIEGIKITPIRFLASMFLEMLNEWKKKWEEEGTEYNLGGTRIEVKGEKGGIGTEYVFSGIGQGMSSTPRTLATVAKMVSKGDIKMKGAYAPEGCIDTELFIKDFSGGQFTIKAVPHKHYHRLDIVPV